MTNPIRKKNNCIIAEHRYLIIVMLVKEIEIKIQYSKNKKIILVHYNSYIVFKIFLKLVLVIIVFL